jgi:hypothetical protein
MLIALSNFLRIRNVADRSRRENRNTRFIFNNIFLFEIRAVCEMLCKNIVKPGRQAQTTMWRISIACLLTKTTDTLTIHNIHCCNNGCKNACLVCECFHVLQEDHTIRYDTTPKALPSFTFTRL